MNTTQLPLKAMKSEPLGALVVTTAQGNHYATTYDPAAARLIAAGPELLEALKRVASIFNDPDRSPSELANSLDTRWLNAAIAKAEGREG